MLEFCYRCGLIAHLIDNCSKEEVAIATLLDGSTNILYGPWIHIEALEIVAALEPPIFELAKLPRTKGFKDIQPNLLHLLARKVGAEAIINKHKEKFLQSLRGNVHLNLGTMSNNATNFNGCSEDRIIVKIINESSGHVDLCVDCGAYEDRLCDICPINKSLKMETCWNIARHQLVVIDD